MVFRFSSIIIILGFIATNLIVFQNCGPTGSSSSLNIGSMDGTTSASKCAAGRYRPSPSAGCTTVGDEYYSPANDDKRYACPVGASTKETPRSAKSDCKPIIIFSTTQGDCNIASAMTTFANGQPIYGCIRGAVEDLNQASPSAIACSSQDGLASCESILSSNQYTLPNADWTWDSSQKAFTSRNLRAFIGNGITFYNFVKRIDGAQSVEQPIQTLP